jgi:hypothetical protein
MNHYGQLALDHNRTHRPVACSQIPDPEGFFTEVGEQIATAISDLRDEILGPRRPGEDLETYRRRGYQALATAEELVLADHHLFQPETAAAEDDLGEDPDLADRYRLLAEINRVINQPL